MENEIEHTKIITKYLDILLTEDTMRNPILLMQSNTFHENNIKNMEIDDCFCLPHIDIIDHKLKCDDFNDFIYVLGNFRDAIEDEGKKNKRVMYLRNINNKFDNLYIKFNGIDSVQHTIYYNDIHNNLPLIKKILINYTNNALENSPIGKDELNTILSEKIRLIFTINSDPITFDAYFNDDINIFNCIIAEFETFSDNITDRFGNIIEIVKETLFDFSDYNKYYKIYINPDNNPYYRSSTIYDRIILPSIIL